MIREVVTSKGSAAVTSDHWHVVRARYADPTGRHPFVREVVSEHGDRAECGKAAKLLRADLDGGATSVPAPQRDEVFVCKPNFKSLQHARQQKTTPR